MVGFRLAAAAIASTLLFTTSVLADLDPIVIKGNKFFFKSNGTQFFIKGVAYQSGVGANGTEPDINTKYVDPLTDVDICKRDIPNLAALKTNTIRVYAIDPTKSHDECMQLLDQNGIYLIADLSAPNISINRDSPSWDAALYQRYTSVIDTLAPYSNVLGFFAGNEVSNNVTNVDAIPFVKAAARDMKAYIKRRGYRPMGVGYAADDDATIRAPLRNFMNCGPAEDSIDFFGYNIYSWCGSSATFQSSGYADRTKEFSSYNIPAFFAEYGCNQPSPRVFNEVLTLFGRQMTDVWSGGIVYEYFQEANDYGLVSVSDNTASKLPDFTALSRQIAKVSPTGVNADSFSPTNTAAQDCPPTDSFKAASSPLPPTPNEQLCNCMVQTLTCVAKDSVDATAYGSLFDAACGDNPSVCQGITHDGAKGNYGAFSMCSAVEQLSWAFDAYYQDQKANNPDNNNPCDFAGNATTQDPQQPSGDCENLLNEAGGSKGTGVVTSAPTGTGSSGGGSAASSSGVAGVMTIPSFDFVFIQVGLYVTVAAMAGAAIVMM